MNYSELIFVMGEMRQCRDMPRSDRSGHDDVIVIPEFACKMGDWDAYYALLREIRDLGSNLV